MKRRILALILALLLCFTLCACGSYRSNDYTKENGTARDDMDRTPDAEDGFIEDDNGSDGILDGTLSIPSPNVSHRP